MPCGRNLLTCSPAIVRHHFSIPQNLCNFPLLWILLTVKIGNSQRVIDPVNKVDAVTRPIPIHPTFQPSFLPCEDERCHEGRHSYEISFAGFFVSFYVLQLPDFQAVHSISLNPVPALEGENQS